MLHFDKVYLFFDKTKSLICHFSFMIMLILLIRSLAESSYAIFGIDFILFYAACVIIEKYNTALLK